MGTVRIRNVGSFGREIRPDLDGVTLAVVEVGGVVEVSARLAESLLSQVGVWAVESDEWVDPAAEHVDGQVIYSTPTVDDPALQPGEPVDAVVIDVEPVKPTRAKREPEPLPTVPADTTKEG
jgi:hypothetical protein